MIFLFTFALYITEEAITNLMYCFLSWRWLLCVLQMGFLELLTLIGYFNLFWLLFSLYEKLFTGWSFLTKLNVVQVPREHSFSTEL